MRISKCFATAVAAMVLSAGCTGGGSRTQDSATPTETTVAADAAPTTEAEPTPIETIEEEPSYESKKPEPTATTPAAPKTRLATPGLPEANLITVKLSCIKPKRIPKLANTNGNDYPRIVFNAMCGSETPKDRGSYLFGQVGVGEGVTCGTEYVIDGNDPTGIAWWCPSKKLLLSSPAAVIDQYPGDSWKLMRELTIAYAFAYEQTKRNNTTNINKAACTVGHTILRLRISRMLTTGEANALMDSFTAQLENAKAYSLSNSLRKGYNNDKRC